MNEPKINFRIAFHQKQRNASQSQDLCLDNRRSRKRIESNPMAREDWEQIAMSFRHIVT